MLENKQHNFNAKALFGAVIGTAAPVCYMMKKQKVSSPLKLEYGLKDMLILSASSIAGGTIAGCLNESPEKKEKKAKEGVFQFINASTPAILSGGALKLCEKSKNFNNIPSKIFAAIGGIVGGMFLGVKIANKIFDPQDKHPDRKLTPKDCIVNLDDAIGAFALAKFPVIQNLHFDKILPAIYAYCGYRAGKN